MLETFAPVRIVGEAPVPSKLTQARQVNLGAAPADPNAAASFAGLRTASVVSEASRHCAVVRVTPLIVGLSTQPEP
ncbi:hypothetical protein [Cereibacter johrii]|uniref:hypothetical protein n=1 Tax=Cereibacter johrii TaxID=445629 RepID=UPI0011BE985A|nr:hypothetical protein [Cereibacter johrii]